MKKPGASRIIRMVILASMIIVFIFLTGIILAHWMTVKLLALPKDATVQINAMQRFIELLIQVGPAITAIGSLIGGVVIRYGVREALLSAKAPGDVIGNKNEDK